MKARAKRSALEVTIKEPKMDSVIPQHILLFRLLHHHALCSLKSTRLAPSPIINSDRNATPTATGFFRCAVNGTLYETCSSSSEHSSRTQCHSTYIYHGSVLLS